MIRVEGHSNLYRDERTGAIVNCDDSGYEQYVKSLEFRKKEKNEIKRLRNELDEIKSLLVKLIDDNNKT